MNPDNPRAKTVTEIETETVSTQGRRLHAGFIVQEIKQALKAQDMECGAWGLDDPTDPDSRQAAA